MRTRLIWLGGVVMSVVRSIFVPTATSRRRSARQDGQPGPRPYAKMAALIVPLVVPIALIGLWISADPAETDRLRVRPQFLRPSTVPSPADNVLSGARIELGRRLFNEARLSADNSVTCATCHNPARSFTDGQRFSRGIAKTALKMHTPSLLNLAWSNALFWDGRARTLEAQALGPIENPEEMGLSIETAVARLNADPSYVAAFASAFPEAPAITPLAIGKALGGYQRTLVSPVTRFDRWLDGNPSALSASEKSGFQIFSGKAGCINCHSGWAFTDYAFHDIGLNTDRRGRGSVIGRPALEKAFKTPTLRELVWTAPYMHNGSIATLEEVVRHYETGGVDRPARSPDLPRRLTLSDRERQDLVAFLRSLSSERPSHFVSDLAPVKGQIEPSRGTRLLRVGQRDKAFQPKQVSIRAGDSIVVVNDDTQPHNVFVSDPRMTFDSGWQEPGMQTFVPFALAGDFEMFCGIHPNMRLRVEVAPAPRN